MAERILSISGLRGIVGDGLDPAFIAEFAAAVGTMAGGGTVVLSRDGRSTGEMVRHAVVSGLLATGCKVVDAGIATTPTAGVLVTHLNAAGGLQITASHNPSEWNGVKPFSPEGSVFNAELGQRLLDILNNRTFAYVPWNRVGTLETLADAAAPHIARVLKLVNVDAIRRRTLKVVLDCNHGSGAVATPQLLEQLGCEVIVLGSTPDGQFAHRPEPLKENLTALAAAVTKHGADAGFAQDPDADRLAIVDDTGRYIGEELTLALCVDHVLATRKGPVVVNGSTSRVTADIAEKHGCPFHRSYVGEAHVVARMKAVSATIGGEGNGGVIEPQVGYVRDSFVAMAYVLDHLAAHQITLAKWADSLPQYSIVKDKLTCPRDRVTAAVAALKSAYSDAAVSEGDGLRLDWPNRWVQVRASNTEPILRVIAEASDETSARTLCRDAMQRVAEAVREAASLVAAASNRPASIPNRLGSWSENGGHRHKGSIAAGEYPRKHRPPSPSAVDRVNFLEVSWALWLMDSFSAGIHPRLSRRTVFVDHQFRSMSHHFHSRPPGHECGLRPSRHLPMVFSPATGYGKRNARAVPSARHTSSVRDPRCP